MRNIFINLYVTINKLLSFFGIKIEYIGRKKYERMREQWFNVLVDVWASRWQSIEYRRSMLSKDIEIYSFEPIKSDFLILQKKYWNNQMIKLYNMWLGHKVYKTIINLGDSRDSSSILQPTNKQLDTYGQSFTETEEITISTLDDIFWSDLNWKKILMKIDVQGFELEVLKWWYKFLKHTSMVIIESSYIELYKWQPLFDDVYEHMKDQWFSYIWTHYQSISPKNGQPMQQDSIFINNIETI